MRYPVRKLSTRSWCAGLSGGSAWAQSSPGGISRDAPLIEDEVERAAAGQSGNFVATPIPFSSPAFGAGLAAVGAYMYRVGSDDPEVPASFTGIGGLYSDTETSGFGFAQNLYLKEDSVRIGFFAGTALVTQIEYRRPLRGRWGIVAFAGIGTVAPSFSDMSTDDLLPELALDCDIWSLGARRSIFESTSPEVMTRRPCI